MNHESQSFFLQFQQYLLLINTIIIEFKFWKLFKRMISDGMSKSKLLELTLINYIIITTLHFIFIDNWS